MTLHELKKFETQQRFAKSSFCDLFLEWPDEIPKTELQAIVDGYANGPMSIGHFQEEKTI